MLSEDEPLRFIFSHSALREGWDNPNVFQICTLNETRSAMKKRQEIGRGLRLPVDQDGQRVFDESINKLFVMANESYEDFAKACKPNTKRIAASPSARCRSPPLRQADARRWRAKRSPSAARPPRPFRKRWSSRRCSTPTADLSRL